MPPCLRYSLGTAKWWTRASLLTGGTQDRITIETIRTTRTPRRKALIKDMLIVLNMFIKIPIKNPGSEVLALFWPLKGTSKSLWNSTFFLLIRVKVLEAFILIYKAFIKDYGNISITPGCIRKIPLNPPLQKGEAFGMPGFIEMLQIMSKIDTTPWGPPRIP